MKTIDNEIEYLIRNGSKIKKEWLSDIKKQLQSSDYDNVLGSITEDIVLQTLKFIDTGTICGISLGINLEDFNLSLNKGYTYYDKENKIDNNTLFDMASITKLFTLLLAFKLEELGYFDLDKVIRKTASKYHLDHFTISDLLKMYGILKTDKRIDECHSYVEAKQVLEKIKLTSIQKEKPIYTDMGMIVLSDILEDVVSERLNKKMTFDQIMDHYLIKPLGLKNTTFYPDNIAGTGYKDIYPNDPKGRILGPIGSAGLFSNNEDLTILFNGLDTYLNQYHLSKLSKRLSYKNYRAYGGINVKHPKGIDGSFAPLEYSNKVYAHQGYTGCVVINDPVNKINNNFLISTLKEGKKDKDFMKYYNEYQVAIVKKTLTLLLLNKVNKSSKTKKITL